MSIPKSSTNDSPKVVDEIDLGKAARELRNRLNLSVREAAERLGVSYVHLNRIENNKTSPTSNIIERFRQRLGVDLYMYALCSQGDLSAYPESLRGPVSDLLSAWSSEINRTLT